MGEVEIWDSKQSKRYLDMPHDTIVQQNEETQDFKLAIIGELLTNHPYPVGRSTEGYGEEGSG